MLGEHRIDDLGKCLVGRKDAVPAGEHVALEPAFTAMLAEHFHHASVGRHVVIDRNCRGHATPVGYVEHGVEPVRIGFVRTEQAEIIGIHPKHVAQEFAQLARRLGNHLPGTGNRKCVLVVVRQIECHRDAPTVGMRIGAHAAIFPRGQLGQLGNQPAPLIEKLVRVVALQPGFEHLEMFGIVAHIGQRNLVRAKRSFHGQSVDHLGTGPTLGRAQHDHRPPRAFRKSFGAGVLLNRVDLPIAAIQRGGK